jgi:hypothetical protein
MEFLDPVANLEPCLSLGHSCGSNMLQSTTHSRVNGKVVGMENEKETPKRGRLGTQKTHCCPIQERNVFGIIQFEFAFERPRPRFEMAELNKMLNGLVCWKKRAEEERGSSLENGRSSLKP